MKLQKFRWSKVYESSEEELQEFLAARDLSGQRYAGKEFQTFDTQTTENDMTLWCAEGSLSISSGGSTVSVQPGDAIRLPAAVTYDMKAGITGCVYYQTMR